MPKLDGLGTVGDFLNDLTTPKIAAQIAKKVLGLAVAPLPLDSRQLHGYPDFRRVDCGEFRIIYRYASDPGFRNYDAGFRCARVQES